MPVGGSECRNAGRAGWGTTEPRPACAPARMSHSTGTNRPTKVPRIPHSNDVPLPLDRRGGVHTPVSMLKCVQQGYPDFGIVLLWLNRRAGRGSVVPARWLRCRQGPRVNACTSDSAAHARDIIGRLYEVGLASRAGGRQGVLPHKIGDSWKLEVKEGRTLKSRPRALVLVSLASRIPAREDFRSHRHDGACPYSACPP